MAKLRVAKSSAMALWRVPLAEIVSIKVSFNVSNEEAITSKPAASTEILHDDLRAAAAGRN